MNTDQFSFVKFIDIKTIDIKKLLSELVVNKQEKQTLFTDTRCKEITASSEFSKIREHVTQLANTEVFPIYEELNVSTKNLEFRTPQVAYLRPETDNTFCDCEMFDRFCVYLILSDTEVIVNVFGGETIVSYNALKGTCIIVPATWTYNVSFFPRDKGVLILRFIYREEGTLGLVDKNNSYHLENFGYNLKKVSKSLIYYENSNLDVATCNELIEKFENMKNFHRKGQMSMGIDEDIKKTFDLNIVEHKYFSHLELLLRLKVYDATRRYFNEHCADAAMYKLLNECHVPVIQIQKYDKNSGFYNKHNDHSIKQDRVLVFMWYLNDVAEDGNTVMYNGKQIMKKIKPEKGKLVIFPSTSTYVHSAEMPRSSDKYVCTGWLISKYPFKEELTMNGII